MGGGEDCRSRDHVSAHSSTGGLDPLQLPLSHTEQREAVTSLLGALLPLLTLGAPYNWGQLWLTNLSP